MNNSEQAIAAAKEIIDISSDNTFEMRATLNEYIERISSIIQKHYAAKDAEIAKLKAANIAWALGVEQSNTDIVDMQRDEFRRIKAMLHPPVDKFSEEIVGICDRAIAVIEQAVPVVVQRDKLEQERDQLKARVAELEKAIKEYADRVDKLLNHCPIDECGKCAEIVCPYGEPLHLHHDGCPACSNPKRKLDTYFDIMSATPSESLTRLQELERKAKALDWLSNSEGLVTCGFVFSWFSRDNKLLSAIENAMEKQK